MQLRGVGKRHGRGVLVFEGVDLDLPSGTLTRLSGANGAGKSTLLRIVAGVSRPSAGLVCDRPREVGYVPDRLGASEALTGRQYLTLQAGLRRLPPRAGPEAIERLCDRLAFGRDLDTPIGRLSKGTTRKLAILQALLSPTRLLVLDEPFAGLDQSTAISVNDVLRESLDEGATVILSDHEGRGGVQVDQPVELVGGRLRAAAQDPAPGGPTSLIRLSANGRHPLPQLPVLPGILFVDTLADDIVSLRVDRAATDSFLAAALAAGWSVLSVGEGPAR